jgi:hypothetical protein
MDTHRRPQDVATAAQSASRPASEAATATPAMSPPACATPVASAVALDAACALDRDAVWTTRRIRAYLATPAAAPG